MRYTVYRVVHELEKRSGRLIKRHPLAPEVKEYISLNQWREKSSDSNLFRGSLNLPKEENQLLASEAEKIFNREIKFFSHEWKKLGPDYNWITNPDTGFEYDIQKHWSKINDFNPKNGDIKYVWEKSRFSYLLTVMRYDHHFGLDNSKFVFNEIESWIDQNPINQGPNWKCSQEISLRMFNWALLLDYYRDSTELTEERWKKIQHVIYWSMHHVFHHINFSRIAVRNNHAITETLMLTLSEFLFPFVPETKNWSKKGRKWFEKEIEYQIYEDGTFLQFSMNYHRVVIQLLSLGISVTENKGKPLSKVVYNRAYSSLDFLYQCLQEENGKLPNYGSNDGALFFPLSNEDYRDYRPQLDHLHFVLTGTPLFETNYQDKSWISNLDKKENKFAPLVKKMGPLSYRIGGYYLLRESDSFTFIRCGNHKDRPAHADNLHLDVWVNGENILMDSGTYKYNASPADVNYFTGTQAHNTVTISKQNQMLKGSRFIWYYWSQAKKAFWKEENDEFVFSGSISAFGHISKGIKHTREIRKSKSIGQWVVNDKVSTNGNLNATQHWHHNENPNLLITSLNEVDSKQVESFDSSYYGIKVKNQGIVFDFKNEISTRIEYKK